MEKKVKNFITGCIFILNLVFSQNILSYSGGVNGFSGNPATTAGNTCSMCHSGGVTPAVNITGPTTVQPGSISTFTLTISDGQQNSGGLNVSADGGTLMSTSTSTRLQNGEVTHSQRVPAASDGTVSWTFDWQAPTVAGSYTIYGAGLSTNGDNSPAMDAVATDAYTVMVSSAAPQSPTAIILAPMTALVDSTVSFNGSTSFDPDGFINQFEWNFGDGNIASGAQTTNAFAADGLYTVTLTVTDSDNLTNTTFRDITVGGVMIPVADPGGPYTGIAGNTVNFDGSLSNHVEAIINYIWDFGDGTPVVNDVISTVSHVYAQAGAYTVTLAVQDANIITGVASTTVVIDAPAPPPPVVDGATLYADNCAACHGALAISSKLNSTASQIQTAIDANTGGMGGFSSLTPDEVQAIADVLVSTTPPPPPPTDGPTLYANNCSACHGPLATSSKFNRSANQIQAAIDANTGGMGGLIGLTPTEITAIADALVTVTPPPPPTDGPTLYANNCSACHGPLATSSKLNRNASQIQTAIDANTGGMGGLNGLTQTEILAIADALFSITPPPPPPTDGPTLYTNNCSACHGPLATSSKLNRSASQIQAAINANTGGMGGLGSLTPTDISAIADALVTGTPPPAPTTGEGLYDAYCLVCHGPGGTGGIHGAVTGESANGINKAINEEPLMATISLNATQIQAIADYLSGSPPPPPPVTGQELYDNYCLACHGPAGTGGTYEDVTGKSAEKIADAINKEPLMNSITLSSGQLQSISDYLSGSGGSVTPPAPTDGATLYTNNCSGCHGPLVSSSKLDRTASQIQTAIDTNTGGMSGLSSLTITEVQSIADALASGGTTPPVTGEQRYIALCQSCHGFDGTGGSAKAIIGVSANQITSAVSGIGAMQNIVLNSTDAQDIATFLASGGGTQPPPTTGEDIYNVKCAACHGPGGTGGIEKAIIGVSLSKIEKAMTEVTEMQPIPLSNGEAQALTTYLSTGGNNDGGDDDHHDDDKNDGDNGDDDHK